MKRGARDLCPCRWRQRRCKPCVVELQVFINAVRDVLGLDPLPFKLQGAS